MKVCPSCDRTYHDDELNFCLMCGMALADGASQPTVAITGSDGATIAMDARATIAEPVRRHGPLFWIGITIGCIAAVTGGTISIFFLYFMFTSDDSETKTPGRNTKTIAVKKDSARATPAVSPTIAVTPTPETETTPTPSSEDVVSITWKNTALDFKGRDDETRTFFCPVYGKESAIFGTDTYAANSSICTAAVHVGLIDFEDGGEVTIRFRPGLPHYLTTTRNGITSNMFGNEDLSFVFVYSAD